MRDFRTVSLFAAFLWLSTASQADTVCLLNGDRVSGRVITLSGGALTIETDHFGTQSVNVENVAHFETSHPVALKLIGEEPTEVKVFAVSEGASAEVAPTQALVPMARIELLAPTLADLKTAHSGGETTLEQEDAGIWGGSVEASASLRSGNTDTLESNVAVSAKRDVDWNVLTMKASAAYGEADDVLNTRRYKGDARWQFYPSGRRYYLYISGGAEHDAGRRLDLRLNAATGAGYDFCNRETRRLSADMGVDFTHEEWNPFTPAERDAARRSRRAAAQARLQTLANISQSANSLATSLAGVGDTLTALRDYLDPLRDEETRTEQYVNLRIGGHFEQQLFSNSRITEELVVFPSLEDFGEFRLTSELAFRTPLRHRLDLQISLKSEYDSRAEESGLDAWDNTLMTGIRYSF